MPGRSHYEVLGVAPTATAAEIRTAYLALARRHHPDRHTGEERVRAERRMQRINAAWTVLGDAARRRDYDRTLQLTGDRDGPRPGFRAGAGHTRVEFRPFDTTEFGRSTDDRPYRRSRPLPRWLTMIPFCLFCVAALGLAGAVVLNSRSLMGLGAVVLGLSAVAFFVVPLFALSVSERDRR